MNIKIKNDNVKWENYTNLSRLIVIPKFCILIFTFLFLSPAASAQFLPNAVSLSANPSSPSPGETVTIEAATPTFDRNTAFFSWTINGKARPDLSGIGKNIISLGAGKLGASLNITVNVSRENGPGGQAFLAIPIADIALTWFSETYVPKWYRGKALPIENSIISVIAIPSFIVGESRIPAKNLIYQWSLDDEINALSGVGQDVFRIKTSSFPKQTYHINLIIEDRNKRVRKEKDLFLTTYAPQTVVYPYSPLGGIESRQGIGYIFSKKQGLVDFIAETFNLPITSPKDLQYNWKVKNAAVIGSPENPQLLTLDTLNETESKIPLAVTTRDPKRSLPSLFYSLFLIRE